MPTIEPSPNNITEAEPEDDEDDDEEDNKVMDNEEKTKGMTKAIGNVTKTNSGLLIISRINHDVNVRPRINHGVDAGRQNPLSINITFSGTNHRVTTPTVNS